MAFWKPQKQLTLQCALGCYPTPNSQFLASLYYIPVNNIATFKVVSVSNPTGTDFCFGPTDAGGCQSDPVGAGIYPLNCAGAGNGAIDGSNTPDEADYTAPATVTTDSCYVTDYAEAQAQALANIQSFNPVVVTSPITSSGSPRNVCVNQTQAITATGGLGTLGWSVSLGGGSVSPLTGASTTYTAPTSPSTVEVQVTDSTTQMSAITYINVINTIDLSPTGTIEVPINNSTNLHYPGTSGVTYVANLNFTANCGLQTYTAGVTGGGSCTPTSGINNNQNVTYTPAATSSTSTITFTDSTTPTAQTAQRTIYNLLPVDVTSNWGYHFCVKYAHSTYSAGTYKIKCWGRNANGQLGYGTTTAKGIAATDLGYGLPFVKDAGITGADMMVKDISVGLNHTCAILANDTVKCWGSSTYGQLGYDNTTQLTSPSASTVNIGGGTPKKIYASGFKTCLVFSDDRLKCWGRNARGELGQDNTIDYGSNNTTASMSNLGYVSIAGTQATVLQVVGSENATCVLTTAGFAPAAQSVYCWGYGNNATCGNGTMPDSNYCGELGRGTNNANWGDGSNLMSALTTVNLSLTGSEVIIDISSGRKHICAIIAPNSVSVTGTPICWGRNNRGQLGINNTNTIGDNESPSTRVTSITTATKMSNSFEATCALLSGGNAKCWGRGGRGLLLGSNNTGTGGGGYTANLGDDGSPAMSAAVNIRLGTGLTAKKIAMGYESVCSILNNDYIKCWGMHSCGNGASTTSQGCLLAGLSTVVNTNPVAAPNMMSSRYIGDHANETNDLLPYVNH